MKVDRKPSKTRTREGPLAARPRIGSGPKIPAPGACPKCGACYVEGRWTWSKPPAGAVRRKCPACRRAEYHDAGGYVTLGGPFLALHREEVIQLVRAREARQKAEHPLERIIAIVPQGDELIVSTTEAHLARTIAHALQEAFKGEMELSPGARPLRARWHR